MERTVLVDDFDGTIAEGVRTRPLALDDEVIGTVDLTDANRELLREELRLAVERFVAKARPRTEREAADARVAARLARPAATRSPAAAGRAAKKVGGKSHLSKRQRAEREQLNAIREWARRHGYEVSPYGKIPERVMEAFQSLHGTPQGTRLTAVTKAADAEGVAAQEKMFSAATA